MTNNNSLDWYKNALEKQAQQMKRDQELTEQYKKDAEELRAAQATETPAAPVEEIKPGDVVTHKDLGGILTVENIVNGVAAYKKENDNREYYSGLWALEKLPAQPLVDFIPQSVDSAAIHPDGAIDLISSGLIVRIVTRRDYVDYHRYLKALTTWSHETRAGYDFYTRTPQPLAELEALRAENAQLRAQVGDWMENYEFEKKQHAITELNAQELEAENAALKLRNEMLQASLNERDNNEILQKLAWLREDVTNANRQITALQNGMKEKDAAFNELMAERNQLRDAALDGRSAIEKLLQIAELALFYAPGEIGEFPEKTQQWIDEAKATAYKIFTLESE